MIQEWMKQLLEETSADSEASLTKEQLIDAINEAKASIKNEELWALGSEGETREMHLGNIGSLQAWRDVLEKLVESKLSGK